MSAVFTFVFEIEIDHTRLHPPALYTASRINTLDAPRFVFARCIGLHAAQYRYIPFAAFMQFNVSPFMSRDVCLGSEK